MISSGRELLKPLIDLVYPVYCGGCGREGEVLCPSCADAFVPAGRQGACPVCGRQVGEAVVCGGCIARPMHFERGYFGFSFEGPFREALHAFKFQGRKDVGRALVRSLRGRVVSFADAFDVIVPLPVTEKRLRARGFNQTCIIGEEISRLTGKPIEYSTLLKVEETRDQYTLSKEERRKNVAGAFGLKGTGAALKGKRLLLVDDLFTTGSTASEAARTLERARPERILFFALARTPE